MISPTGFVADPAFQDDSGNPASDGSDVFYDGNSQGGIFGGTVMAVAQVRRSRGRPSTPAATPT